MNGWDRESIAKKVTDVVDRFHRFDPEQFKQLLDILKHTDSQEVFEGLFHVLTTDKRFVTQEFAGILLFGASPTCHRDNLDEIILMLLPFWKFNMVWQVPWYLEHVFGTDQMNQAIRRVSQRTLSSDEAEALSSFEHCMHAPMELRCHYRRPSCTCPEAWHQRGRELKLHHDTQDMNSDAWKRLLDVIAEAVTNNVEELNPGSLLTADDWHSIITLPPEIKALKSVRRLYLYNSSLVWIPPEIGEMTALEEFIPYQSYRLHWFPYEITRCPNLRDSTISTRALYGNVKNRNPFPDLRKERDFLHSIHPDHCSVCKLPLDDSYTTRWISLKVATDVVPLLVFACSGACIDSLPPPPDNYVPKPHHGSRSIEQPPRY